MTKREFIEMLDRFKDNDDIVFLCEDEGDSPVENPYVSRYYVQEHGEWRNASRQEYLQIADGKKKGRALLEMEPMTLSLGLARTFDKVIHVF